MLVRIQPRPFDRSRGIGRCPIKYIVLDFETFYDSKTFTLKKLSTPEYIGHRDFKVHCLGVEYEGQKKILWGDAAIRQWLDGWRKYEGDYCFVMHNAYFDAAILKWHYNFSPKWMVCTMLLANHVLGSAKDGGSDNSLAGLATLLGLRAKGRLDFMDGVRDPDPAQRAMLEVYLAGAKDEPDGGDLGITRRILDLLLPHITNADSELWLLDHTLKLYTERPMILNFDTVDRAERLVLARREKAIERLMKAGVLPMDVNTTAKVQAVLSSNPQFEKMLIDALRMYNVPVPRKVRPVNKNELKKFAKLKNAAVLARSQGTGFGGREGEEEQKALNIFLAGLQKQGVDITQNSADPADVTLGETKLVPALAKKDEEFIRLSFSPYEGISALVNARLIERSAITSAARLQKMRRVAGGLKVMPVHLVYGGAHTLRWSGGGGFNFLNLTSPDRVKDPGAKEIATAIREAFEAPPGYVFVSADASQIEARVSAWIAGQWDVLELFRQKQDVYSVFISGVLNEDIHKPKGTESPEVQAHLKLMRHIGKEAVLGLGYSMGWRKFVARLREDPDVARMFEAGKLDDAFCQDVVRKYREKNSDITACWGDLNAAFLHAKNGGVREVGPIKFRRGTPIGSKLPVVNAILPSGRTMYYRNIRQEEKDGEKQWKHGNGQKVYGGLLLENMTQTISRDILVDSIIRCELDRQLPVALHVYDSITVLAPENKADDVREQLMQSLRTVPDWADDRLVLDAESKVGKTLVA